MHSANRKIHELKVKAAKVEEATAKYATVDVRGKGREDVRRQFDIRARRVDGPIESDEKYLKTLNETIKRGTGCWSRTRSW